MRKITYQQLVKLNACADQLALFKQTFGDSGVLTEDVARKYGHLFDVNWLAGAVLSAPLLKEYNEKHAPLLKEYDEKCATLSEEYAAKRALLLKEYATKCATLLEEYAAKRVLLWEEYKEKCAPLWKEYLKKRAQLFVKLYNSKY